MILASLLIVAVAKQVTKNALYLGRPKASGYLFGERGILTRFFKRHGGHDVEFKGCSSDG